MKTNKNTSNSPNADTKFFGIPVKCNKTDLPDYEKLIAYWFLHPKISSRNVKYCLNQLDEGIMTIERLLSLTRISVNNQFLKLSNDANLPEIMCKKIQDWTDAFGEPTASDWDYLEKNHNFKKESLVNERNKVSERDKAPQADFHSPKEMATCVKERVYGQDKAIDMLSVPFFQQYESKRRGKPCLIKTPVLLIGPTGSGKSAIFQGYARCSKCIIVPINSSEISGTQWKGTHMTDVILRTIKDKHGPKFKNIVGRDNVIDEYICVLLDEVDKIPHHDQRIASSSGTDFNTDIMCDIMRMLNSGEYLFLDDGFNQDGSPKGYRIPVDNILVVFAGAFSGIEDIVRKRLHLNKTIGFSQASSSATSIDALLNQVTSEDLIEWGFMPELIGRIGNICALNSLTPDLIYNIMTNAKDNILQSHIDYCHLYNIDLHFTPEALHLIADVAYKSGLGFRNVKTLLSRCLTPIYYEFRDDFLMKSVQTVNIDRDFIAKQLNLFTK